MIEDRVMVREVLMAFPDGNTQRHTETETVQIRWMGGADGSEPIPQQQNPFVTTYGDWKLLPQSPTPEAKERK